MRIVKNLGDRYTLLCGYQAVDLIRKAMEERHGRKCVSDDVWVKMRDTFGNSGNLGNLDMPFLAYEWKEEKKSGKNMWWRLSTPFLLIWIALFSFILCPLKWVATGKYSFSQTNPLQTFSVDWYNKIFDHRWSEDR